MALIGQINKDESTDVGGLMQGQVTNYEVVPEDDHYVLLLTCGENPGLVTRIHLRENEGPTESRERTGFAAFNEYKASFEMITGNRLAEWTELDHETRQIWIQFASKRRGD